MGLFWTVWETQFRQICCRHRWFWRARRRRILQVVNYRAYFVKGTCTYLVYVCTCFCHVCHSFGMPRNLHTCGRKAGNGSPPRLLEKPNCLSHVPIGDGIEEWDNDVSFKLSKYHANFVWMHIRWGACWYVLLLIEWVSVRSSSGTASALQITGRCLLRLTRACNCLQTSSLLPAPTHASFNKAKIFFFLFSTHSRCEIKRAGGKKSLVSAGF